MTDKNANTQFDVDIPELPAEMSGFALEMAELAKTYGIRNATMDVGVDTGPGTRFWGDSRRVQERVKISVSLKDGRGRPRTQIKVSAAIDICTSIVYEPDSTD